MEDREEFPREESRGSATEHAYSVEARYNNDHPKQIGDTIFYKEWKPLPFEKSKVGVPNDLMPGKAKEMGLLSYQAAQALRWWFHASLSFDGICFETRILKHIVESSYSEKVVGAFDHITGAETLRPNFKNKKE